MNLKRVRVPLILSLVCSAGLAGAQDTQSAPPAAPAPVPYESVSQLNGLLAQLEQASQTTQVDLGKLRVEKWKTDSKYKKQTQGNVESIERNLQTALPEMVTQLRNSPEDLSASFKLYRNLDALYDVLGSVVESAGAFGAKDEFQSLSNDLNSLERARRSFAERMESLTTAKESELTQLRTQVKTLQAAAPPPTPKKVIVDDEAPKKPVAKKKVPRPPAKPATNPATSNPAPSNPTPPSGQAAQPKPSQ